jgi:hypothetical protein
MYGPPVVRNPGSDQDLPEALTRDEIRSKMENVRSTVRDCTAGASGTATVRVTIGGRTGRVTNVAVSGDYAGEAARCIADAVRGLLFRKFPTESLTVTYSYRF